MRGVEKKERKKKKNESSSRGKRNAIEKLKKARLEFVEGKFGWDGKQVVKP